MLPVHPIVYLFILRVGLFKGMPDDQFHSELTRIMEIINTRTGYIGGDGLWWVPKISQYGTCQQGGS